jgi:hypothetical protein
MLPLCPYNRPSRSHTLDEPDTVGHPTLFAPSPTAPASARAFYPEPCVGVVPVEVGVRTLLYRCQPSTLLLVIIVVFRPRTTNVPITFPASRPSTRFQPRTRLQSRMQNTVAFPATESACVGSVPDPKPCVGVVPVEVGGCQDPSRTVANQHFAARSWRAPFLPVRPPTYPLIRFPHQSGHCAPAPPKNGLQSQIQTPWCFLSQPTPVSARRSLSRAACWCCPSGGEGCQDPPLPLPTNTLLLAIVASPYIPCDHQRPLIRSRIKAVTALPPPGTRLLRCSHWL